MDRATIAVLAAALALAGCGGGTAVTLDPALRILRIEKAQTAAVTASNKAAAVAAAAKTAATDAADEVAAAEAFQNVDLTSYTRAVNAAADAAAAAADAQAAADMAEKASEKAQSAETAADAEAAQQMAETALADAEAAKQRVGTALANARKFSGMVQSAEMPFAPVFRTGTTVLLGADVVPATWRLTVRGDYRGVVVRSGWVRDGEAGERVVAYLNALMTDSGTASSAINDGNKWGQATFAERPVLRIARNTSAQHERLTLEAVARVNRALPWNRRILIGDPAPTPGLEPNKTESIPDGQIFVDFAVLSGNTLGHAISERDWEWDFDAERWATVGIRAARVAIDRLESDKFAAVSSVRVEDVIRSTLMHELLHALGLYGHVPPDLFRDSTMTATLTPPLKLDLPSIDADVLLAAYTRFEPGTESFSVDDLGPWSDASFHLRGDLTGGIAFGVAFRNGLARPWAFGPMPYTDLTNNRALSGSVAWNGALLGFTPEAHTVAGDARIGVNLASLAGRADFTELERFGVRATPGPPGSGTPWLDGDLGYTIAVGGATASGKPAAMPAR